MRLSSSTRLLILALTTSVASAGDLFEGPCGGSVEITGQGTYERPNCWYCWSWLGCQCDTEPTNYYYFHNETTCNTISPCPLYVYIDGTTNADCLTDRDDVFLKEMAFRGFVAVSAGYEDEAMDYMNSYGETFDQKTKAIFDDTIGSNSIIDQMCNQDFVDCSKGVAVNGWSQGAHIAALAGNHCPDVTAALLFGNGNDESNTGTEPCINADELDLPNNKRRSIAGEFDTFYGGNFVGVQEQQIETSGYDCSGGGGKRYNCFNKKPDKKPSECGAYGTGENYCPETGRYYQLNCSVCDEEAACPSNTGIYSHACPLENYDAGYYIIPNAEHDFMDVNGGSTFMDSDTVWGLPKNFDWLASTATAHNAPISTSNPTSAANSAAGEGTSSDSPSASTSNPTTAPVVVVSESPSSSPTTTLPTKAPSVTASASPSASPTKSPITKAPTKNPTNAPTTAKCVDDENWTFTKKGKEKNCNWVADKANRRCKTMGDDGRTAKVACQATCVCNR